MTVPNRAKQLTANLQQYTKYVPGKPIKSSNGADIPGTTAISSNASVYFDPHETLGGHFLERHGANDKIERFRLTHENAIHLQAHLKKYNAKPKQQKEKSNDKQAFK